MTERAEIFGRRGTPTAVEAKLAGVLGSPPFVGNRVTRLRNGKEIFPAMLAAVAAAETSVELATFVYWKGEIAQRFAEALAARARAGVAVRVILDAFGAQTMRRRLVEQMTEAGVDVRWFRPLRRLQVWENAHRTHRKLLICDGRVGFVGGVGIAEEWQGDARHAGEWRDTHFRLEGPAIHALQAAFLGNWLECGGALQDVQRAVVDLAPVGSTPLYPVRATASIGWSDAATMLRFLVDNATERLDISTAYFVPDTPTVQLLCERARAGVTVRVLVPGEHHDQRVSQVAGERQYDELLAAGVQILQYQRTMLHTKIYLVDGRLSAFGSINFNQRSVRQDDEFSLIAIDRALYATLQQDFENDLEHAEPVTPGAWRRRGLGQRLFETMVTPFRKEM